MLPSVRSLVEHTHTLESTFNSMILTKKKRWKKTNQRMVYSCS